MSDLISRQVISEYVESHIQEINTGYGDLNSHTNRILRMIVDYIEKMPSVQPKAEQEPKTGHWIKHDGYWECSECHAERAYGNEYCPDCGSHNGDIAKPYKAEKGGEE